MQFKEGITTNVIAKAHQRKPSRTARKAVSRNQQPFCNPLQADAYRLATKAIELLGQLYPARLLFLLAKKV